MPLCLAVSRRSYLLLLLAAVLAIAVVDYWPEPKAEPPVDYEALTIAQLIAGMSGEDGNLRPQSWFELQHRGWRDGPEVLEALFSHEDAKVRGAVAGLGFSMSKQEASAGMAIRWRDRLLRTLADDEDMEVREAAVWSLAYMVREELLGETPPAVIVAIRELMKAEADGSRSRASIMSWWLGEDASVLLDDLLVMDVRQSDGRHSIHYFACHALKAIGVSKESAWRYLLDALRVVPLLARWRDQAESPSVRVAAVGSLAELAIEQDLARDLLQEVLSSRDLYDRDVATWVACVTDLAVRAQATKARSAAVLALRDANLDEDLQGQFVGAAPGAIARIAAALGDQQLLEEVLPALLVELEATEATLEQDLWFAVEAGRTLAFEGLVDVCRWRNDQVLRQAVKKALESIGAHEQSWTRKWTREQIARLEQ
jgi:hypothetical protein